MVHSKVKAAGVGGAVAIVLVFVLGQLGVAVPADVGAAAATILGFLFGFVKSAD